MEEFSHTTKWVKRFMRLAHECAFWSKDMSTKVGSVIVTKDNKILGLGYNGLLPQIPDNVENLADREFKLKHTIHSEVNAIMNCNRPIHDDDNATMFVTKPVCSECAKFIALSKIKNVVYYDKENIGNFNERWNCEDANSILENCGINVIPYSSLL